MVNERVEQMKRQQFISLDSQFISELSIVPVDIHEVKRSYRHLLARSNCDDLLSASISHILTRILILHLNLRMNLHARNDMNL